MDTIVPVWLWVVFVAIVLAALFVDFVVLKKQGAHEVGVREALNWSVLWVALSLAFNGLLWWAVKDTTGSTAIATEKSLEFLTGYLIEKSLAVDNIFVFLMIFTYFAVPPAYQKRVLMIGILGAIVLRTIMILVGAWLLEQFHWVLYVFGAFLVLTGIKMLVFADQEPDLERNPALRWMRGHLRVTTEYHGERFTVMKDGVRFSNIITKRMDLAPSILTQRLKQRQDSIHRSPQPGHLDTTEEVSRSRKTMTESRAPG